MIVQIEIRHIFWIPHPEIKVRFIPYFEIPLCYLILAITLHQMPRKSLNQLLPFAPIFRRRYVLLVPERVLGIGIRRQLLWHKTQLDKRSHFIFKQSVINLVYIRKVVHRLSIFIFVVQSDLIVKNGVEANIFEVRDSLDLPQIVPVTFAQRQRRAPRTKHFFPEMWERMRWRRGVDFHRHWRALRASARPRPQRHYRQANTWRNLSHAQPKLNSIRI